MKAGGAFWVVYRPRGRNRPHRRLLGLWAPADTIAVAREAAAATVERRARARESGAAYRARVEEVGRTRTLTLEERAELAARACIRHRYTDYEERLRLAREEAFLDGEVFALDDRDYHLIKEDAHLQVDEFIERHRRG